MKASSLAGNKATGHMKKGRPYQENLLLSSWFLPWLTFRP
jgi:hypothetical protein